MPSEIFKPDENYKAGGVIGGYSSADAIGETNPTKIVARFNPTTGRLLVDASITTDDIPASGVTDAVSVQIVDASGNQITSFGGGVQYTEGDTDASITGNALMLEKDSNTLTAVKDDTGFGDDVSSGILSGAIRLYNAGGSPGYDRLRGDATNGAWVNIKNSPQTITGIGHGVKTVTTAGTDVALASTTACKRVIVQAQTDNTGFIAVGATGVDATVATGTGVLLYAGDSIELDIDDLADIFIDSTVNGDGVRYTYFT